MTQTQKYKDRISQEAYNNQYHIEDIAKAIQSPDFGQESRDKEWAALNSRDQQWFRKCARAAVHEVLNSVEHSFMFGD